MATPTLARVFSGIQPTGAPHLGNYFGALVQWRRIAEERKCLLANLNGSLAEQVQPAAAGDGSIHCDSPIFSIVDVHAYCSAKTSFGHHLYQQILSTTASLLAIGLNPNNCILFRQSDVLEHNYLDNVLDNFISTQRLTHMTQFKEKSSLNTNQSKDGDADYLINKSQKYHISHI